MDPKASHTPSLPDAEDCRFRRMGLDDLPALVALERQCFSHPWREKQFRLGLEGKVFKVFGLEHDGALAAYVSFYHVGDEMEILNLAVVPELRRRGLGRRLLRLALAICRRMGVATARLEARQSNQAALALYSDQGFEPCGVRKGYYPDNKEDAVCMVLDLSSLDI